MFKKINNKPLIFYPIQTAKKSKYIKEVFLTSDSNKIINIAKKYGAIAPFNRPKNISGDNSRDIEYLKHFIKYMNYKENVAIVILQPTTPFREVKIIDKAIEIFMKKKGDSLRSVSLAKETPYKMWLKKGSLMEPFLGMKNINQTTKPRQKLKKV